MNKNQKNQNLQNQPQVPHNQNQYDQFLFEKFKTVEESYYTMPQNPPEERMYPGQYSQQNTKNNFFSL